MALFKLKSIGQKYLQPTLHNHKTLTTYWESSSPSLAHLSLVPDVKEYLVVGPLVVDANAVLDSDAVGETDLSC